jgi:hypothetical protein
VNIADVMDELGTALDEIEGLTVFPYWADQLPVVPAATIAWPDIDYNQTFGRGTDSFTIPIFILVGTYDAKSSRNALAAYLDGGGDHSVIAAIDAGVYTSCDVVNVASARVDSFTSAGIEYLGAEFRVEIVGDGE